MPSDIRSTIACARVEIDSDTIIVRDEGGGEREIAAGERRARRFLRATAISYAIALALFISLAVYVNPWGNFGPVGYHSLFNSRLTKLTYFDSLPVVQRPEVVVLGASPALRMKPSMITEMTGARAFNYCVFWGRTEDYLCLYRHWMHDLDYRPAVILLAIDTFAFAPPGGEHPVFPGMRRRLLNIPALVRHHPDVDWFRLQCSRVLDCFSRQHVEHCWRAFRNPDVIRTGYPSLPDAEAFDLDGTCVRYFPAYGGTAKSVFEQGESGELRITRTLQSLVARGRYDKIEWMKSYDFDGLWDARIRYLRAFLDDCEKGGTRVVLVLNPVHPVLHEALSKRTKHTANVQAVRRLLSDLEQGHPAVSGFFDAYDLDAVRNDPDGFFDEVHYATRNADRILAGLRPMLERSMQSQSQRGVKMATGRRRSLSREGT